VEIVAERAMMDTEQRRLAERGTAIPVDDNNYLLSSITSNDVNIAFLPVESS
jgi:hypothetical protein